MGDTTHIRLSGHVQAFPLTPAAHTLLLRHLAETRAALAAEPDGDESFRDLESAIGDRLATLTADSDQPVDEVQMRDTLAESGPVNVDRPASGADHAVRGPFWCRIIEGKWFGGICLGISARGGFRVDWVRTVVLLLTLLTGGFLALVYLVLLLVLPPVSSIGEYERLRNAPRPER